MVDELVWLKNISSFLEKYHDDEINPVTMTKKQLLEKIEDRRSELDVAKWQNKIIGMIRLKHVNGVFQGQDKIAVVLVGVDQEFQNRGVAQ